jgi:hypothetical protein
MWARKVSPVGPFTEPASTKNAPLTARKYRLGLQALQSPRYAPPQSGLTVFGIACDDIAQLCRKLKYCRPTEKGAAHS